MFCECGGMLKNVVSMFPGYRGKVYRGDETGRFTGVDYGYYLGVYSENLSVCLLSILASIKIKLVKFAWSVVQ